MTQLEVKQDISFTIYGEPVAQGRPRAGRDRKGNVQMYDPLKSRDYKQYVKLAAAEHRPSKLLSGELELVVDVYRQIPKSLAKYKRALAIEGKLRPITKPDVDNYVKGIKDGLSGIIWEDDKQVVDLTVRKWYSDEPRVEVQVKEVGQ
ncbi:RusA family crossover junction endodeoxyribonuclease [Geomicrobium sediminis]|uniref:Holliday junction resolvase RusA-like endonuclease n=1 Tax=Geomicrobium sediminis TaxID=1347788 RepID=A0ABS2PF41_9BACL|nr:RusA family crossover junction endodeoxyribonuclease [Geomicrobium sediminis]MBM7634054.1 Holliday junction resolvase RusA-like endonuclease [Geomicrobium sediminis]